MTVRLSIYIDQCFFQLLGVSFYSSGILKYDFGRHVSVFSASWFHIAVMMSTLSRYNQNAAYNIVFLQVQPCSAQQCLVYLPWAGLVICYSSSYNSKDEFLCSFLFRKNNKYYYNNLHFANFAKDCSQWLTFVGQFRKPSNPRSLHSTKSNWLHAFSNILST